MQAAVFLLLLLVASVRSQCPTVNTGSSTLNFNSVGTQVLTFQQSYQGTLSSYQWVFNLCTPTAAAPPSGTGTGKCPAAGYVNQYDQGGCTKGWNTIMTPLTWNAATLGGAVLMALQEPGGSTANLIIQCSPTAGVSLINNGPVMVTANTNPAGTYTYNFRMYSSAACPGANTASPPTGGPTGGPSEGPTPTLFTWWTEPSNSTGGDSKKGLTGGGVFVIIFFVSAFVYVAGTVAYNYLKLGKRGLDVAPHPEFWKGLPGLMKDGALFLVAKARGLCGGGAGGGTSGGAGYKAV